MTVSEIKERLLNLAEDDYKELTEIMSENGKSCPAAILLRILCMNRTGGSTKSLIILQNKPK